MTVHMRSSQLKSLTACFVGAMTFLIALVALRQLGGVVAGVLDHRGFLAITTAAAGFVLLSLVDGFVVRRFARGRGLAIAAGAILAAVSTYGLHLQTQPDIDFHGIYGSPPGVHDVPQSRWLPATQYRVNEMGFRGDAWSKAPEAGVARVAVVGDSFVFGQGVQEPDTLPATLAHALRARAPGRRVEVLNFGIPGDAVAGHVAVARLAARHYGARVVIVCLLLPNDMNRWGTQRQAVDARRPSLYSVLAWLFGPYTAAFTRMAVNQPEVAQGHAQASADLRLFLAELRIEQGPATLLYVYDGIEPWLSEAVTPESDTTLVDDCVPDGLEVSFPVDGHPTAAGNRHHGRRLAPFVARALGWTAAEGAAPVSDHGQCAARGQAAYGPWRLGDVVARGLRIVRFEAHGDELTPDLKSADGAVSLDLQRSDGAYPRSRHVLAVCSCRFVERRCRVTWSTRRPRRCLPMSVRRWGPNPRPVC